MTASPPLRVAVGPERRGRVQITAQLPAIAGRAEPQGSGRIDVGASRQLAGAGEREQGDSEDNRG